MSGISEKRKQYLKSYYEKNKANWNRNRKSIGLAKHADEGQLSLLDFVEHCSSVDEQKKVEHCSTPVQQFINCSTVESIDSVKQESNTVNHTISSVKQVEQIDSDEQLNNVHQLFNNQKLNSVNHVQQCSTLNSMADDLATQLQSMAFSRLFPTVKKTWNPWALSELSALVLLSLIVLFFTAQAVAIIDQSLMPLVALLEFVAMFFSLTLAKCSGFKLLTRVVMILSIVGLTNFLVAKATWNRGEGELIARERAEASRVVILSEIERERATILDLQARGRITQASERTKRLDSLIARSEQIATVAKSVADRGMIWIQVALRVLLGLALILINGQISEIIVKRKLIKIVG